MKTIYQFGEQQEAIKLPSPSRRFPSSAKISLIFPKTLQKKISHKTYGIIQTKKGKKMKTFNQSLDNFDTSNVMNMTSIKKRQKMKTFNQSLDNFDTSNVTNMTSMFYKATSFNQDLSGWDVSDISSKPPFFNIDSDLDEDDLPIGGTTGSN